MNTIDFESRISITLRVDKIAEVNTVIGVSIYIEGTILKKDKKNKRVCFYCPDPLEHILKQMNLTKGDTILIRYLGKVKRKDTMVRDFYVERVEK